MSCTNINFDDTRTPLRNSYRSNINWSLCEEPSDDNCEPPLDDEWMIFFSSTVRPLVANGSDTVLGKGERGGRR